MADNLFIDGGVNSLASTVGNWSLGRILEAGDTARFDPTSPDCTWDIATCPVTGTLAAWDMTGYAGILTPADSVHTVRVAGDSTLNGTFADSEEDWRVMLFHVYGSLIEGVAFSSNFGPGVMFLGTGTITWSVTGQGTLDVDLGIYSATEQIECLDLFVHNSAFDGKGFGAIAAGKITTSPLGNGSWTDSGPVSVGGDLIIDSTFTLTNPGTFTMTGTGELRNPTATNIFPLLVLNGAAALIGNCYTKALTGSGSLAGAYTMYVNPTAAEFVNFPGAIAAATTLAITLAGSYANAGVINSSGPVTITGNGFTLTQTGAVKAGVFTLASGTLAGSGTVQATSIIIAAGAVKTYTGIWTQTGIGLLSNPTGANSINSLVVNGAATLTNHFYAAKLTGIGTLAGGFIMNVAAVGNNFMDLAGPIALATTLYLKPSANHTNAGIINSAGPVLIYGNNFIVSQSGKMTTATLTIRSQTAGANILTLALSGAGHSLGAVTLGGAGNLSGVLDLRTAGSVRVASLVRGAAENENNAFKLGKGSANLSGIYNSASIAFTAKGGRIFGAGSITNLDANMAAGNCVNMWRRNMTNDIADNDRRLKLRPSFRGALASAAA
ncbi:MAG TPA: hypothetical protein VNA25_13555 [Phycisphaerae bacterium]|nr:hypothetical protein [Phycisphaerae bacterium]